MNVFYLPQRTQRTQREERERRGERETRENYAKEREILLSYVLRLPFRFVFFVPLWDTILNF
jgi:hypothetical protein